MSRQELREATGPASPWATRAAVLLIVALAAAALAFPGQTVSAKYLNDLMIFLDGAHRIVSGQVPHVDFHTPMGPLVNLLPALGLLLTGSLGAAMPVGVGLLILALAPMMAHVLASRLNPALALATAVYLALILAAPANLGEPPQVLSFAMFYNRIGWAALALLLVMVLPPRGAPRPLPDALCAAALVLLMLYLKASYGAVALAFLAAMLLDRNARPWAALALASTLAVTLALEAAWRLPSAYLLDLLRAAHASGAVQGGPERLLVSFQENLFDYAVFALVAAVAAFTLRDWRLLVFLGFCGGAGLMIQNQNFQISGIVTLAAGAVVAAEAIRRRGSPLEGWRGRPALAAAGVLLLIAPMIVDRGVSLGTHVVLAGTKPAHRFALPKLDRIVLADTGSIYDVRYTDEYVATLDDGARALAALGPKASHVVVLDFVNPFSAGLGLAPPRGDYSVTQFERTFDKKHFVPAEAALGDARVVMEPKWRIDPPGTEAFLALYADYLSAHFVSAGESEHWRIFIRRDDVKTAGKAHQ
ncbi:MAG TPA: hypothetical protein VF601_02875 [Beijerinckiaceae bacterium]